MRALRKFEHYGHRVTSGTVWSDSKIVVDEYKRVKVPYNFHWYVTGKSSGTGCRPFKAEGQWSISR
eukprot:10031639-Karenia_brevis.AAC.1